MKKSSLALALLFAVFMVGCASDNDTSLSSSSDDSTSSSMSTNPETPLSESEAPIDTTEYLTIDSESVKSLYFGFAFTLPEGYRFMEKGEVSTAFGLAGESYDKNHEEKTATYIIDDEKAITMEMIVQDTDLSTSEADTVIETALDEVFLSIEKEPEIAFFTDDWGKIYGTTQLSGSDKKVNHYILVKSIENKLCQITISYIGENDLMSELSTAFSQIV